MNVETYEQFEMPKEVINAPDFLNEVCYFQEVKSYSIQDPTVL